jgi:hypothetical protein
MRLIDADALLNQLEDWRGDKEDLDMEDGHDVGYFAAMSRAMRFTKFSPTIDAELVVRCKDCINSQLIYDAERVWCNVWREEVERNGFCHHGGNGVSNVPEKNVGKFGGVINAVD